MTPDELKSKIETLADDAQVFVRDQTGTQDHYEAVVVSKVFEGKLPVERRRLVLKIMKTEVDSGEVHALSLKNYTPDEFAKLDSGASDREIKEI